MFGLVSRRRLEEARRHADYRNNEHVKLLHQYYATENKYLAQRRDNVRLRRELHALRNHVPLLGDVFNGSILR